jgi:hypothetical protein
MPQLKKGATSGKRLDDFLCERIVWSHTADDALIHWRSNIDRDTWTVRVNDFPDEHLYTLFVNEEEVGSFDQWPRDWIRSSEKQTDGSTGEADARSL